MLIDVEGGDHLSNGMFISKGWDQNPTLGMTTGRVRGQSWEMTGNGGATSMSKVLPSTYASVVLGIGFRYDIRPPFSGGTTAGLPLLTLASSAGSVIASVSTNSSSRLQVTNNGGTVIATGTTVIAMSTWYYVELKLITGTSGSCELHLNGVSGEIGSTVGNFGTTAIGRFQLTTGTNSPVPTYDDWYLQDLTGSSPQNDFLGDVVVETLFPNADGTHQDWTPNPAGTHFNKVNETIPDGDTTFVSDLNAGDIDSYHVGSLAALSGNVYGVVTNLYARKDDATGRQIAPVIREAGADHIGTTTGGITTSYLFYRQVWQNDPLGAAWTIANVNGSEYGVKEVT